MLFVGAACGASDVVEESLPEATVAPAPSEPGDTAVATTAMPSPSTPSTLPPATVPTALTTVLPPLEPVTAETVEIVFDTLQTTCAQCHAPGGPGSTHWELVEFGDAAEFADILAQDTTNRVMPPWPASDLGLDFIGSLALSDEQIGAIRSWAAEGAPVDHPELSLTTPVVAPSGPPAIVEDVRITAAEAYSGGGPVIDDYRCQIFDPGFSDETWVRSWAFEPDQTEVIHHAVVFAADASLRDTVEAIDARDTVPGWPCYGLTGVGNGEAEPEQIMGWAPGQGPNELPDGSGLRMGAGDFLIVQVHYHYDDLVDVPADRSAMVLDTLDPDQVSAGVTPIDVELYLAPAEIPCAADENGPLCDRDVAAADLADRVGDSFLAEGLLFLCGATPDDFAAMTTGVAWSSCDHRVRESGELVGVFGHMHEIGSAFRMTVNPGEADERIILDIPRWNFEWQLQYRPVEPLLIERGDIVRVECVWDRALRSPLLEPAYVLWGEGTNDEMCYSTLTTRPVD